MAARGRSRGRLLELVARAGAQGADQGDTTTIAETVTTTAEELEAVAVATDGHTAIIDEVVADKGYHSNQTRVDLATLDLRTYIAEPDRGRRNWTHQAAARDAVYANRRRIRGVRGLALSRRRSEYLERPNAHLYEPGGMRRTHLRGHTNILKRLPVHIGGFNLGLLMRGRSSASARRGACRATWRRLWRSSSRCGRAWSAAGATTTRHPTIRRPFLRRIIVSSCYLLARQKATFHHDGMDSSRFRCGMMCRIS